MYSDMKAFEDAATILTQERNKLQRDVDALIKDLAVKEKQLHQQMTEMTNHQQSVIQLTRDLEGVSARDKAIDSLKVLLRERETQLLEYQGKFDALKRNK